MNYAAMKEANLRTREQKSFQLADDWAKKATCPRASVGCVLMTDEGIFVGGGYNGAPEGQPTCQDTECLIEGGHCVRAVHAEIRAITYAARRGIATDRATAFLTLLPCVQCLHALYLAGVRTIYYDQSYDRPEREQVHRIAEGARVALIERTRS